MVTIEKADRVGWVWLDAPDRLNAVTIDDMHKITAAFEGLEADDDVRVIVLAGQGRAFCAGMDTDTFAKADPQALERARVAGFRKLMAIHDSSKITIGVAHGYTVGGGLSMILACDIRIAATDTTFFIPEIDLGIPYVWGSTPLLVEAVGAAHARELMLTGRKFTAEEAVTIGAVNERHDQPHERARDMALLLAEKEPSTVQTIKALVAESIGHPLGAYSLDREADLMANPLLRRTGRE